MSISETGRAGRVSWKTSTGAVVVFFVDPQLTNNKDERKANEQEVIFTNFMRMDYKTKIIGKNYD
jgi:hypothetical protein